MDLLFGKRLLYPAFDSQNFGTSFPIFQHQFLSQPINTLPSSFLAPPQNGAPPVISPTTWSPTTLLPHCQPAQEEILPQHPQEPQFPPEVTRVPPHFHLLGGIKGLMMNSKDLNGISGGHQSFYRVDSSSQQDLCYTPYVSPPAQFTTDHVNVSSNISCPVVPLPKMSKSSFHVGYYVPPSVDPGDPYGGLDFIWNQHFEMLFSSFPHRWSFAPSQEPLAGWTTYKDMAKVRFSCQKCQHGWTSMHGVVIFYYKLDHLTSHGEVRFVLMGQKCAHCQSAQFETPMWYPEEAQKVMTNLFHEIASKIYFLETPPPIRDRRHGRPRQQHVASNCQGCHLGICKTPPATTSKPPSSGSF